MSFKFIDVTSTMGTSLRNNPKFGGLQFYGAPLTSLAINKVRLPTTLGRA